MFGEGAGFLNPANLSDILFEEGRSLHYHVVDYMAMNNGAIYLMSSCAYLVVRCKDFASSSSSISDFISLYNSLLT